MCPVYLGNVTVCFLVSLETEIGRSARGSGGRPSAARRHLLLPQSCAAMKPSVWPGRAEALKGCKGKNEGAKEIWGHVGESRPR